MKRGPCCRGEPLVSWVQNQNSNASAVARFLIHRQEAIRGQSRPRLLSTYMRQRRRRSDRSRALAIDRPVSHRSGHRPRGHDAQNRCRDGARPSSCFGCGVRGRHTSDHHAKQLGKSYRRCPRGADFQLDHIDTRARRCGADRTIAPLNFPLALGVIAEADWVIDLGPEGGLKGGAVVGESTPDVLVANARSHTGAAFRPVLARGSGAGARSADGQMLLLAIVGCHVIGLRRGKRFGVA